MLNSLTPEQDQLVDDFAEKWLGILDSCKQPDTSSSEIREGISLLYSIFDRPFPSRVLVLAPEAALDMSRNLGEPNPHFDLTCSWYAGWDAWRLAFHELGVLSKEDVSDLLTYCALFQGGVYDTVLLEDCAIIIPFPLVIVRDDSDELHCSTGPAIAWSTEEHYYWHGLATDKKHVLGEWTKEDILLEKNTEQRRVLQERLGPRFYELMGALVEDSWNDPNTGLLYELLVYEIEGEIARALRKQSPLLKNGTSPVYCERVNVICNSAMSARKWQATRHMFSTSDETARACNVDPILTYGTEA